VSDSASIQSPGEQVPEPGQLVEVRSRQWVVADVDGGSTQRALSGLQVAEPSAEYKVMFRRPQHFVTLSSIDEDALGEELEVIWEVEPGARVLERAGLPTLSGFDPPATQDAFLDAVRWGAATNADVQVLQSPFRSGIAIEDYQLDPVVRALDMPRVNLLIADDVGLGKTIEAGLVAQELLLRHRARSVLVVCPASLQIKWREEMAEKFGLEFRIVDTAYLRDLRRSRGVQANPWTSFPRLITSIDWLKGGLAMRLMRDVLPMVPQHPRRFDLLILDEAHNAAPSGSGRYAVDSQRTAAIRAIAPHFEHRLFLSATPHNGYLESFSALLELLDHHRFARGVPPDEEQKRRVMVRRLKSDIVDSDERPRFPVRRLMPLEVEYTDEERRVHAELVEYSQLRSEASRAAGERFATDFVLKLLKKRLFSSPAAFATTLEAHRASLERPRDGARSRLDVKAPRRAILLVEEAYADDDSYEEAQEDALEVVGRTVAELGERERTLLDSMTNWAESARHRADSKAEALIQWLEETIQPAGDWSDERVIVFTEYRMTQKWLVELLTNRGYGGDRLSTIFGGMDALEREAVKAAFQADPKDAPVRILVATDAAAEGIDLQNHCYRMVHFEVPWNPNVLEQRNGRIDRHGQRAPEVLIWHPVGAGYRDRQLDAAASTGALEGDLEFLMIAARKVQAIREDLGSVGPVIARQVEEAMLGERSRLETGVVEREVGRVRRELAVERQVRERVSRLHEKLVESRTTFRLEPENVRNAVEVALRVARLPEIPPAGEGLFDLPPLPGSWARCHQGLEHPHTRIKRPITFDHEIARGNDQAVLVHLEHPLSQMCLRLLRAEVWAPEESKHLHRVSARLVPNEVTKAPVVCVWSRLVITGGRASRLHEELTAAGGQITSRGISRLGVRDMQQIIDVASLDSPSEGVLAQLTERWPRIEDSVAAAAEARSRDRLRTLMGTLERRARSEADDVGAIIGELEESIRSALDAPPPAQMDLFSDGEKTQRQRDVTALRQRLDDLPAELEAEREAVRTRFADPEARTFPVAITFFVPESMRDGLR
jgi:superfamily II DNA or RNA helicase